MTERKPQVISEIIFNTTSEGKDCDISPSSIVVHSGICEGESRLQTIKEYIKLSVEREILK